MKKSKILISGTGRSGTTFLIKIFSFLNFDTGFDKSNYTKYVFSNCNSGMEHNFNSKHYILKNPTYITRIDEILELYNIKHMIIPIRDYEESAKSRESHKKKDGGLWNATDKDEQLIYYYKIMSEYLYKMVKYNINTIFLDFIQMTTDKQYLYDKLKIILDEKNIDFETFSKEYDFASENSKPKQVSN
jgi:hypothetical protein